ncbi:MAG TPA: porin [Cyanobacteria bacterium UBA11372]|nr:porin [Cyanobacteria bacterium UBA11372]
MDKFVWYGLPIGAVILMANCAIANCAIAPGFQENPNLPAVDYDRVSQVPGIDKIYPTENLHRPVDVEAMEQVTSVSQLTDIDPSHWAFQALQSLVERYGCIEGYPERTYRGNRALSRYEFAAGLNACLDRIQELIAAAVTDLPSKEDLATIRRLQEEFQSEITGLRERIDPLETRTAKLEANQFSTTTQLRGFAAFNLTNAWAGDEVKAEGLNPFNARRDPLSNRPVIREVGEQNITFSNFVVLTLNTSFTGKDLLVTELGAGNGNPGANNYISAGNFNSGGVPFFDQTVGVDPNDIVLRELLYSLRVANSLRITVGPRINWFRFFDANAFTFPGTGTSSFNSINSTFLTSTKRGAGAVIEWNISKQLEFHLGYLVESLEFLPGNRPASDPSKGLFEGTNTITAELTYKPSSNANIRLLYQRSNLDRNSVVQIDLRPIFGVADDGFGGGVRDATSDTFGINFDWLMTKGLGVFGRYTYASTHIDPVRVGIEDGRVNAQTFQVGLAFPDLGKRGALATLSFVVPFDILAGEKFLVSGAGNGGTQYEIEASYYLPLTQNIAVVPGFYVISNINNFDDNPTVFVGNLRTQFSF